MPKGKDIRAPHKEKYELSAEEKQRRSELAKRLHSEGKFGGRGMGQGRKRKPRVSELLAERANDKANAIARVYEDGIKPNQPIHVRLKAANDWVSIAQNESKLQLAEDEFEEKITNASQDQLIEIILNELERPGAREALSGFFDVEGSAVEFGPGELTETSESYSETD